jgi:hypothetical protein
MKLFGPVKALRKRNGVVINLIPTYNENTINIEFISERITKIKILVKGKEMNFLQIYAPQTGCSVEEEEEIV